MVGTYSLGQILIFVVILAACVAAVCQEFCKLFDGCMSHPKVKGHVRP